MKIGVYNRYWSTSGGGERYISEIAKVLAQDHEVELISIEPIDWSLIESRLNINLSQCKKTQWPNWSCEQLSPLSARYELFVNGTYGSAMFPQSKKSLLICFFPHSIDLVTNHLRLIRMACKNFLHRYLFWKAQASNSQIFWPIAGYYDLESSGRVWAQDFSVLSISTSKSDKVVIPLWPGAYNGIKDIKVEGHSVKWVIEGDACIVNLPTTKNVTRSLTIEAIPMNDSLKLPDTRNLAVCIDSRKLIWDVGGKILKHKGKKSQLQSLAAYDRIISISQFTTEWIIKRWNLPSSYLPPPIDTEKFTFDHDQSRESIIISVGRFFAGGHNKKHHEMAEAFIRMRKEGVIPLDWRLILVGSRHLESSHHIDYFESLLNLCKGHPIEILSDLPFSELLLLYRKATIYWHATGWGEATNTRPERQEHFGITTCEAMASGCVPVVFDAAGQREIVNSNLVGFRYADYPSLAEQMRVLTNASDKTLSDLGARARRSISRYALSDFSEKVKRLFVI